MLKNKGQKLKILKLILRLQYRKSVAKIAVLYLNETEDAYVAIFVDSMIFDFTASEFHNDVLLKNKLLSSNSTQIRSSANRVNTWFT